MSAIAFTVRGLPKAQGVSRAFVAGGKARIATDSNRANSPIGAWRTAIATEARAAVADGQLLAGPVRVVARFTFPRPKGHYLPANARRPVAEVRLDAPDWHTAKPDVDKLTRALLDALTSVVWRDDSQVADVQARKRYGDVPGVVVEVHQLEGTR